MARHGRAPARAVPAVSWAQVHAFRLARHHLDERAPAEDLEAVVDAIAGAQAQLLTAAKVSLWARLDDFGGAEVDDALWRERTLVRAWCMRRTLYLLPADELAVYGRGSTRRAEREVRWMLNHGLSEPALEELLRATLDAMEEPVSKEQIAHVVSRAIGGEVRYRSGGGGWGNRRKEPWVRLGRLEWPVAYLLHVAGARGVICSGPERAGEATYVRADRWVPHWRDLPIGEAEEELVRRYLRAFGPATPADFALWSGVRLGDSRAIWSRLARELAPVEVDGWPAWVLARDRTLLGTARMDGPVTRLLPHFDVYLLAHEDRGHLVASTDRHRVYRPQGWVSPVLLHNGEVVGVWSQRLRGPKLEVVLRPFGRLARPVRSALEREGLDLGRFLGSERVSVTSA